MSRSVAASLTALSLLLVLFPLTLGKPGLPTVLKSDEPAYYGMALSLARDGDLRFEVADADRLFQEFPYRPVSNLILMTDDGWHTAYYGKPYVYSLFAAPFAALFGANGLLCFNMLLLMGLVWMGTLYLSRFNGWGLSALFAGGFFLVSVAFPYAFWLHPEVFNMAAVGASLFLGFWAAGRGAEGRLGLLAVGLSGAVLALAVYNKPVLAILGAPVLFVLARGRRWAAAGIWLAGAAVGLGLTVGLAWALTGHATPYLGVERQGVVVCEPGRMPIEPRLAETGPDPERPTGGAWSWIFRVPEVRFGELLENLGYFLWGRHAGLLPYMPFALLATVLFLLRGRRRGEGWVLLGALGAVALFFLTFIPHNWQGGGGFVGNRYFVNAYPAFLFLVTEIRPRASVLAGYLAGGLFLGPVLFTPFGAGGPEPTLQSHVRNTPLRLLPLEHSLREVPGYRQVTLGGWSFKGRADQFLPRGDEIWLRGADRVEVYVTGTEPLGEAVFLVRNLAPGNRVRLSLPGIEERLDFPDGGPDGERRRVVLTPDHPSRVRTQGENRFYIYRLVVRTDTGRIRAWTRRMPPETCPYFAYQDAYEESFFVGAGLIFLGSSQGLEGDLYAVAWDEVRLPESVHAGESFSVPVRLTNRSSEGWVARGAARVKLSYHWRAAGGEPVVWNGERTELPGPVPPGAAVALEQTVVAPEEPGRYVLELDPVFEHVAWFSQRGSPTFTAELEVLAPPMEPEDPAEEPGA